MYSRGFPLRAVVDNISRGYGVGGTEEQVNGGVSNGWREGSTMSPGNSHIVGEEVESNRKQDGVDSSQEGGGPKFCWG